MSDTGLILAVDQGTTSTRAMLFDAAGRPVATARRELTQHYPREGWVEHDAEQISADALSVCREVVAGVEDAAERIRAVGVTNQRETAIVWDREDGRPIHRAIVWQDRRTAEACACLREAGHETRVAAKTGLLLDPYFSATKIAWILDHVDGARSAAESGRLAFGTPDSWLLWQLTGGRRHVTDATNASRTLLFDIHRQRWDDELLELFRVPRQLLPEVLDCADAFGTVRRDLIGREIPVTGVAGDQQAALVGQACFEPGMVKSTYGTGCFVVLNTGVEAARSKHRLLTTVAYRLDGRACYALEGSIFIAGAAVKWLRDGLRLIRSADETESLARSIEDTGGVVLVPAFTGLGAPHWDPGARAAVHGLTLGSGVAELVRATLESVAYQTHDLLRAMSDDRAGTISALRVDGGMVVNDWLAQFLADVLDVVVDRPAVTETTALGAAMLAALGAGQVRALDELTALWTLDRRFEPSMDVATREKLLARWSAAVSRTRSAARSG